MFYELSCHISLGVVTLVKRIIGISFSVLALMQFCTLVRRGGI